MSVALWALVLSLRLVLREYFFIFDALALGCRSTVAIIAGNT